MSNDFDAIVIGSGITGGWAAKELTERGLRVLMIERGPMIEHQSGYTTEMTPPWELPYRGYGDPDEFATDYAVQSKGMHFTEWTKTHFVNDRLNPYETPEGKDFQWRRGYQMGGRSLTWGRQCYRWGDLDFGANARDGHGVDWPVRYADMKPWYDHVEGFIGVSGSCEGLPQLPDGKFLPARPLNAVETALKHAVEQRYPERRVIMGRSSNITEMVGDRGPCQNRNICARGCSYGGYFSTQASTLPAAQATGRLTIKTDSIVEGLDYDAASRKVTGVRVIDAKTKDKATYSGRIVFLCAGSVNSVSILLRSASPAMPEGLGNSSGTLGRYFMDHALSLSLSANIAGFDDHVYFGNRPSSIIIPRWINVDEQSRHPEFLRGYSFQGGATRRGWPDNLGLQGLGQNLVNKTAKLGHWSLLLGAFAECLPRADNRITLSTTTRDRYGMPLTRIDFSYGENEHKLLRHALEEAKKMIAPLNATITNESVDPGSGGGAVHEMGGARMGADPGVSVVDGFNRMHDVANLFVTDGAAMSSSACQNPSLTYMAFTARAAAHAVDRLTSEGI
ncbi:GMC family oxidoreductase [Novosphingobium sp. 1949]|uniref:GMC family oxidoreductase n=1 Tax=Novosphingobium organovorum TaxID=2930092 RepID=A0ABT0BCB2_9SPHN|nr:GMC family oxidoreductase [Novosphingobium organovorum]MCJ2182446.1 GMC family oxidoreductase [Novosphingobium organovorum]